MPNVFIVNRGGHDYSAAAAFGELRYLSDGPLDKYDISQMVRLCQEQLEESGPDDYILLTSLTSLCSIACSLFAVLHKRLNLLIYKDGKYVTRRVLLWQNGNE